MSGSFLKSFHFTPLFFTTGAASVFLCAFGFAFPVIFLVGQLVIALMIAVTIADIFLLYRRNIRISAARKTPRNLGLGDDTRVVLHLEYHGTLPLDALVIDELPEQLQIRNLEIPLKLISGWNITQYTIRPTMRGVYHFGRLHIFIESPIHFVKRKISLPIEANIAVYPSVAQMHAVEMRAISRVNNLSGNKRFRRIGLSYEFEQIAPFVEGDNYRNMNWKATGKTRELMINQYQDERSQNMYCVVSKGRAMKMTFKGMSMLDYAINSTLAISNVGLKKYDKVGLITFSNKIGTAIRADNRHGQLQKINEALYAERERDLEPSYELLYRSIDRIAPNRSLLLMFANFETMYMMDRALPILRKINKKHLLVMILFKDEDLMEKVKKEKVALDDIYEITLAKKHLSEREEIAGRLRHHGIQTVVSSPKDLSINVINKYLELKSRGII